MTEEQAKRGLEALKEQQANGEYFATMWMPQIEERLQKGQPLPEIIAICLDTAAKWYAQAGESYMPTSPMQRTVRQLFGATGERIEDYGYKAA